MSRLSDAIDGWKAGEHNHIPRCCRLRWLSNPFRPSVLSRVAPDLSNRLRRHLRPRYAIADGVVPCEYHALRFLLTGQRPVPDDMRNNSADGFCCEHREAMAKHAGVTIQASEHPDYLGVPFLLTGEDEQFSLMHCPWCGEGLANDA